MDRAKERANMTTENDWKTRWIREVRQAGGYGRRIEDKYQVGFPDMIVQLLDAPMCFIEAKLVRGRYFSPTPRQLIELQTLSRLEGHYQIIVGYDHDIRSFYMQSPLPRPATEQKIDTRTCWTTAAPFTTALRKFINEQ